MWPCLLGEWITIIPLIIHAKSHEISCVGVSRICLTPTQKNNPQNNWHQQELYPNTTSDTNTQEVCVSVECWQHLLQTPTHNSATNTQKSSSQTNSDTNTPELQLQTVLCVGISRICPQAIWQARGLVNYMTLSARVIFVILPAREWISYVTMMARGIIKLYDSTCKGNG